MKGIILSIGSELLRGDIVDTNAAFLAQELTHLGIDVVRVVQVGDELPALNAVWCDAFRDADVVLSTGGLGPTQDDLTRDAIAAVLSETMETDPELAAAIERRFAGMNRTMPRSNLRQALLIPSARALPNPHGTAPGWYVEHDLAVAAAMPGPPHEMRPMWTDEVRPRLADLCQEAIATRALMTFGIGESTVEQRIERVIGRHPAVSVATYAKANGVQVHITARAATVEEADALLAETERDIRSLLGPAIYGTGDETLAAVVGRCLDAFALTIGVMESATGGELSTMLTNNNGSSEHFVGGIIAYSRQLKVTSGVDPAVCDDFGLISGEVATEMARAIRRTLGTDIGIGVTGIAGTEPVEDKPPGTCFVAVAVGEQVEVREIHRPASRVVAKQFFAQSALDLLRRMLNEREEIPL